MMQISVINDRSLHIVTFKEQLSINLRFVSLWLDKTYDAIKNFKKKIYNLGGLKMFRVLATDGMAKSAVEELRAKGYEVVEQFYEPEDLKVAARDFDVLVVRSATKVKKDIIDAVKGSKLKLVIRGGVGIDNIDKVYAEENGIAVTNTPKASSASVAELVIGQMISVARFLGDATYTCRNGAWNKKKYEGIELAGKTLGLFGFGRIAREVAKRAKALGMKVIFTDIFEIKDQDADFTQVSPAEVIKNSDFISLHVPAQKDKPYLLGKEEIAQMKDGVILVNAARGGLIDEDALVDAVESGKVYGAALDVFKTEPLANERLMKCSRIVLTPHIGAATKEAQDRIGEEIVSIITERIK